MKGKNLAQMSEFDDEEDVEEEVKAPPAKLPSKQASSGLFGGSVGGLTLKPKVSAGLGAVLAVTHAHSALTADCRLHPSFVAWMDVAAGPVPAWRCEEGEASAGLGAAQDDNQDGVGDCRGRIRLLVSDFTSPLPLFKPLWP